MGKKGRVAAIVFVILFVATFIWAFMDIQHTDDVMAEERHTYIGRVTAIEVRGTTSRVYLNSTGEILPIRSPNLQLAVGEEYEIIVDGNWRLINARIIQNIK